MFDFPGDIEGWLAPEEGARLYDVALDKVVLEIGSFRGRSTVCLAQAAAVVHAVDWHRGDSAVGNEWTLSFLIGSLRDHGCLDRVVVHVGRAQQVLPVLADGCVDVCFIDGAHDFDSCCFDLLQALRLVRPGGVVLLHDWDIPAVRDAAAVLLGREPRLVVLKLAEFGL